MTFFGLVGLTLFNQMIDSPSITDKSEIGGVDFWVEFGSDGEFQTSEKTEKG